VARTSLTEEMNERRLRCFGRSRPTRRDQAHGTFKTEALADPGQLPGDELFKAVDYGDGSDERFLRRLWDDLYGDEPIAGH